jgi:hypothetical protein
MGEALARWAMGKGVANVSKLDTIDSLAVAGKQAAMQGVDALKAWFNETADARTKKFEPQLRQLQKLAREAESLQRK